MCFLCIHQAVTTLQIVSKGRGGQQVADKLGGAGLAGSKLMKSRPAESQGKLMFRTDDNYNLYYDGAISREQETAFQTLIAEHQLSPEFTELLKRHYNFSIKNSYHDHKKLLWIFYKVFGSFAITIFSAEEEHPHGCEYQSRVDYFIDENGNYEYEMKNSLFKYDNYKMSDECNERIKKGSAGYEKDCKVRGNIREMQLEPFVKSLTAGLEK